ncbi:MAG TPA: CopD family protein, partial [Gemmatimonadaceae bacterium]|nr:CopD family protein [Gemmatimonadaceae bacterium]
LDHDLAPGRYHVEWKTAGRDGHPVSGDFYFEIANPDLTPPLVVGEGSLSDPKMMPPMEMHHDTLSLPSSRSFNAESPAYALIRFVQFVALVILLGAFAFWHVVLRLLRRKDGDAPVLGRVRGRHERLAIAAAAVLLLFGVIRLVAQSIAMHGIDQTVFSPMLPMIVGTSWGIGWLLQMAGSLLVILGVRLARRDEKRGWNVATVGAIAIAFSPALSGHAASSPHFATLAVLSDGLHVMGAGGWLGSLFFVIAVGVPAALSLDSDRRSGAVASLVNVFSPAALMFAAVVAATGVFAGWLHIGSIRGLFETTYGRTLIVKLGILSLVIATGAHNWLRVKPTLGKTEGTTRLKKTASAEILIAIFVLAVTAVLVATPTAIDEELMRPSASAPLSR